MARYLVENVILSHYLQFDILLNSYTLALRTVYPRKKRYNFINSFYYFFVIFFVLILCFLDVQTINLLKVQLTTYHLRRKIVFLSIQRIKSHNIRKRGLNLFKCNNFPCHHSRCHITGILYYAGGYATPNVPVKLLIKNKTLF